jgi:single-stranded-DNA-specific exonuclease
MEKSISRILAAKEKDERIIVYGDYDADGITATVLLLDSLRKLGIDTGYYIPDRLTEGYGLHTRSLEKLKKSGADLIITVDCGIRSVDEIKMANAAGLDIIVTDHHAPGPELPSAFAIINPKQEGDSYPFKQFAGVGLAYKLSEALSRAEGSAKERDSLEWVAIGTVADLAPMLGENRYLVAQGIERMNRTENIGIRALMEIASIEDSRIGTETIGYVLGPRINAAGRLTHAKSAVELLMNDDRDHALQLATELNRINRLRQKMTGEIVKKARMQVLEGDDDSELIIAWHPEFHEGVVGLAAARLSEEFYRPAIVATYGDEYTRGSARSIPGFNITDALDQCADLLKQYGGHSSAAGFTIPSSDLDLLWDRLRKIATEKLKDVDHQPTLEIDAEVSFNDLDEALLAFIDRLQPCGMENPVPMLGAKGVQVLSSRGVGVNRNHLKLMVKKDGRMFDAIAFRKGHLVDQLPSTINVAFHIERNEYMGYVKNQLNVQDIQW